ncbi:uncharacterized protein LOC111902140 [Lactuca sativa]|nr:uncharacterized protein LOC111902140 [Lactuca sativa]
MMDFHINEVKSEENEVNSDEGHSVINTTSPFSTNMVFNTSEDLKNWAQNVARSLGYVIVTRRSKPNLVVLMCDRGGIYTSKNSSRKNIFSKKINCPFNLAAKYSKANDFWTLRVICDEHNHEPAERVESHAYARRLSDEETRLVEELTKKNVKPMDILLALKEQNKNNVSSLQTVYNARQKFLRSLKEKDASQTMVCDIDAHTYDECLRNNRVDPPIEKLFRQSCLKKENVLGNFEPLRHGSCSCLCSYINQFPNMFERYITEVQDVKSDGNCGFRAIAVCLGFNEDAWPTIRSDLMDELNTHKEEYDEIFGRECRLQLHDSLNFFRTDIDATFEYWMTLPDMGILIASRYNVVLHCLSVGDSLTYLPLWSTPPTWHERVAVAIGLVNGNHYVKLTLQAGYPMPPIVPQWTHYRYECASSWVTPYITQLDMYNQCYHSHCNFEKITKDT